MSAVSPLSIGIQLPTADGFGAEAWDLKPPAQAAEAAGFDSIWVGDHFALNVPVIESVVAAATAAACTERIKIGFGVLLAALRHPGWLAKQVNSLQAVSGGRILLGLGVGGEFPSEWTALGVPIEQRGRLTDTFLEAAANLLGGSPSEIGEPWHLSIPALLPCVGPPPLWIGGRSDASLRRAARYRAGWLGLWLDETQIAERVERLRVAAEAEGVPLPPVGLSVLVNINDDPEVGYSEMARYMETIYGIPFARLKPYAVCGGVSEVTARLAGLVSSGVTQLVLIPGQREVVSVTNALREVVRGLKPAGGSASTTRQAAASTGVRA